MSQTLDPSANIESVYPLSPMQEGMLFHTLLRPSSGIYLMQNRYRLEGDLQTEAFIRGWREVVARHPILRTSFVWKSQKRPLQVVHKAVEVPFDVLDLRGLAPEAQEARIAEELQAELDRGFDFGKAPLMRLRLARLDDRTHELVHSFHHILLDEWCTSVLMMEFLAHYEALARGEAPRLQPARPYRDYIDWIGRQDVKAAEAFWRAELAGFTAPTPLGFELRSAPAADEEGRVEDLTIRMDAAPTAALRALAQRHRLTLNTIVQGAWALLLSHYSGEREVLFGVTVAGRPPELPDVESIVGLFINTLPLRVAVPPDQPLVPWLAALLDSNLRLRQHEHTPLVDVQRWSEIERGQALFQSLFVFENAPIDPALREGRIVFRVRDVRDRVHTNYPLTVMSWPDAELPLKLSYDRSRVSPAIAARLLGHLRTILEGMAANPDARLGDLPILTRAEREQALSAASASSAAATAATAGADGQELSSYAARFHAQVARTPDAVAATCGDRRVTYAELNRDANRAAHALLARGVGPEQRVALVDDRGIELLTMMLAVFKAGAAYVPLEPAYPAERAAQILSSSEPRVVLTRERHRGDLERAFTLLPEARRPEIVTLEGALGAGLPDGDPEERGGASHLAYVIYTSGSTGAPKGAMVERRGMLNNMLSKLPRLSLAAGDVIAQTASPCFDISVWQFLTALLFGGVVDIVPDEIARDPGRLLEHVERRGIAVVEVVPGVLQGMLDAARERPAPPALARLRWVLPTGEALPPELARAWLARYPGVPLMNAYGPAECSDDVALHPLTAPPAAHEAQVPIGRAVDGLQLHVLDHLLAPLPVGVCGDLYVGGIGVGRGYLGDPRRTAEAFLPDPFSREPGKRLYRTGDLGRAREDGTIEFAGRRDHQVKIRGFRIELGEIEARLVEHPAVQEAVVLAREDRPGARRLVAYVTAADPAPPAEALRAWLAARVPGYMVPPAIVRMAALPRTANGKVDRRALPAPEAGDGLAHVPPRTATEERLAAIWAEVLGVERPSVEGSFFDLGGHSLLLTQIFARVRRAFEVEVPLRTLFETPTIAAQARAVEAARGRPAAPAAPPLAALPRGGPLPLSFAQERLWFLAQLDPTAASYNIPAAVRLVGPLDVGRLERAFEAVVRRHEPLRTTFAEVEGRPVMVIAAEQPVRLAVVDLGVELGAAPAEAREAEARRALDAEARRPFDLARGPLFRITLLRLDEREHVLLVVLHHLVSDGWSMNVLVGEVTERYAAEAEGRAAALPPLPVQYADYARWQRDWLEGPALEQQLAYFQRRLGSEPDALSLPADRPRPAAQSYRGARHAFALPSELSAQLTALARRQGVTPFVLLLAAFEVLLARYSGRTDLWIGTPVANRTRIEVHDLIGFFANTLVLRADLSDNPRFTDLLARVREEVLGAQAHQDLPFEHLVKALRPARDLGRTPLFQVMFTLQQLRPRTAPIAGLEILPVEVDPGSSPFDLSLDMALEGDELSGSFEYSTDLFDRATIERMAGHLARLLEGAAASPEARLSELPMLAPDEQRRVLAWGDAAGAVGAMSAPPAAVHRRFEQQAARAPDAVAVVHEDRAVTYAELDRRANQLAHRLRRHAVGPEVRVGVCLPRSIEMVAAVLAVLKAGGAYVPIDPNTPRERIAAMIADAAIGAVVTGGCAADGLPAGVERVLLEPGWASLDGEPPTPPAGEPLPEQAAYILYTSGSTGVPKGVVVPHRALAGFVDAAAALYAITPSDRVLQFASLSFDASAEEIFPCLARGATLVLRTEPMLESTATFLTACAAWGVTVLDLPTMYWHRVAADVAAGLALPPAVRLVILGGEAALPERVGAWRASVSPRVRLCNTYGPTEATVVATACDLTAGGDGATAAGHGDGATIAGADDGATTANAAEPAVPIGRPIAGARAYVLDAAGQPAPVGVVGELYLGGQGLARGYWARPALTADRFVPDPFSATPGARLYRTGDRARWRTDGQLEFAGRVDHQIKLRGFRIELGEIEARLAEHDAVREVVVLAREDQPGAKRLVAYVVTSEPAPAADALRAFLQARLPDYMVPSAFVFLPELPRTANGKVNRGALPPPARSPEAAPAPPREAVEAQLAEIWAAVLGHDQVGIHDNFFEVGGDSILSLQVVARAREAGVQITPRQIFQHQTIAELAVVAGRAAAAAEQGSVTGEAPLTPIQRWFFAQPLPNPHHWNQALLLALPEPLDWGAVEAAAQALLRHHDALRLRFLPDGAGWRQVHAPEELSPVAQREDLSAVAEADLPKAIEERAARWQASLSLTEGPLLRVIGLDPGPRLPGRLLLIAHHLVVDGVSWRILLEDLQTACEQARRGEPIRLPAKTTAFKRWAERLEAAAGDAALQKEAAFWLDLPWDRAASPRPDDPSGERTEAAMAELTAGLDEAQTRALLEEVPEAYRTRIEEVLLTALAQALGQWTGSDAVAIEVEGHGREELDGEEIDLSRTVGWFTSVYPIALEVAQGSPPGAALRAVKEQLRRVPRRGLPFGVVRELGSGEIADRLRRLRAPSVAFNYLGQWDQVVGADARLSAAAESSGPEHDPRSPLAHELEIDAAVYGGRLEATFRYSARRFRQQTVAAISGLWRDALQRLIAHCVSPDASGYTPSDFPDVALQPEELDAILAGMD
ncbi:amino acid adenylation domain-containing protein [Sorangium sp. So ce1024]|uniref:amino acid adenylation domain-containing protein n=1 Tax=Sorangium sp. So ce1024 TaxID=3133327 RepID=UPI003EFEA6F0